MRTSLAILSVQTLCVALAAQPAHAQLGDWRAETRAVADCLGLSFDIVQQARYPTKGEARQPTKDEQKQWEKANEVMGKIPAEKMNTCHQQAMGTQESAAQRMIDAMTSRADAVASGGGRSEAPGREPRIEPVGAGHFVLRDIDWVAMQAEVTRDSRSAFSQAVVMFSMTAGANPGTYRADFYFDRRYDEEGLRDLAQRRLDAIIKTMSPSPAAKGIRLELGSVSRDAEPRIEIVKKQ